jgi:hypothetical protein
MELTVLGDVSLAVGNYAKPFQRNPLLFPFRWSVRFLENLIQVWAK